jgi:hypothetical protein
MSQQIQWTEVQSTPSGVGFGDAKPDQHGNKLVKSGDKWYALAQNGKIYAAPTGLGQTTAQNCCQTDTALYVLAAAVIVGSGVIAWSVYPHKKAKHAH